MTGLVVKNTGSWYQVKTDAGELVECKMKGHFRIMRDKNRTMKDKNPIMKHKTRKTNNK